MDSARTNGCSCHTLCPNFQHSTVTPLLPPSTRGSACCYLHRVVSSISSRGIRNHTCCSGAASRSWLWGLSRLRSASASVTLCSWLKAVTVAPWPTCLMATGGYKTPRYLTLQDLTKHRWRRIILIVVQITVISLRAPFYELVDVDGLGLSTWASQLFLAASPEERGVETTRRGPIAVTDAAISLHRPSTVFFLVYVSDRL
jgi:hypothetical protein